MIKNITKRDIIVFILGFLTFFLVSVIYDWEDHKESAIRGWNDAKKNKPFNP